MANIGFEIRRKCAVCGKPFIAKTIDSRYCSPRCSKVAYKRKHTASVKASKLAELAGSVPATQQYLSVREAVAMFGVERCTLYRLLKDGRIPCVNLGKRLIRINRTEMERLFLVRVKYQEVKSSGAPKLYSLEPDDCYTIGEVCRKYHLNESSVWSHVRKHSIPSRQMGNYVYVPKIEIDNLYKSDIE